MNHCAVSTGSSFPVTVGLRNCIMITCPCNVDPLTPQFYIVKLGFTVVYIFSYFCSKTGERTGLVVRASDSGSGDPGSILGRVGVLFP